MRTHVCVYLCATVNYHFVETLAAYGRIVENVSSPIAPLKIVPSLFPTLRVFLFVLRIGNTIARLNAIKGQQTCSGNVRPRQVRGYLSAS